MKHKISDPYIEELAIYYYNVAVGHDEELMVNRPPFALSGLKRHLVELLNHVETRAYYKGRIDGNREMANFYCEEIRNK